MASLVRLPAAFAGVITSYSIHYTKLYETVRAVEPGSRGARAGLRAGDEEDGIEAPAERLGLEVAHGRVV